MTYDNAGNMLSRKKYSYTTGTLGSVLSTQTFTYGKDGWGDVLTKINSTTVTSDASGNMLSDGTNTYTWKNGRQLATVTRNGATWTNTYDASGMRTQRVSGSTVYAYIYDGGNLSQMTVGSNALIFTYGINGQPMSVKYNGVDYYYVTNSQGDVVGILNGSGTEVVTYTYDAWGNILSTTGSMASTLGAHNPLRYRGYVYDQETGLYYLQSRYYNPTICRFISADNLIAPVAAVGCNQFIYCCNNPVSYSDSTGHWVETAFDLFSLGVSVVDVVMNPLDPWAWAGLAGDAIDLIPFATGIGESIKGIRVVNKVDDVADTVRAVNKADNIADVSKIATNGSPNSIGKIGEQLAGINPKAKTHIQVNGRMRIPDALTATTLTEVKNVKYISNTIQLRDFATFAKNTGRTMELYDRPTTKVAQTVIDAGWIIKYLW